MSFCGVLLVIFVMIIAMIVITIKTVRQRSVLELSHHISELVQTEQIGIWQYLSGKSDQGINTATAAHTALQSLTIDDERLQAFLHDEQRIFETLFMDPYRQHTDLGIDSGQTYIKTTEPLFIKLSTDIEELHTKITEDFERTIVLVYLLAALFILISFITAGVSAFLITRHIIQPLQMITGAAQEIADGNLEKTLPADSHDEIGKLALAFNQMTANLRNSYGGVAEKTRLLIQKVEENEKKNKQLEDTKRAVLNLLEDERELEASLKAERDTAATIVTSIGEALVVLDKNFQIVEMNPVAQDLLKMKFTDVKGKKWEETVPIYIGDTLLPVDERPLARVIKTQKPLSTYMENNYKYESSDKKRFPIVEVITPLLSGDTIDGIVSVFRDITQERHAKELIEQTVRTRTRELMEEQARFKASIESLRIGYIMTDTSNQIITINSSAKRTLYNTHHDNEEYTSKLHLTHPQESWSMDYLKSILKDAFDIEAAVRECIEQKKQIDTHDIEFGQKFLHIYISPIILLVHGDLQVIGSVIIVEDTTEAKILQRSRDEFFSIASHELRTPLTAIRGNTSLIQEYFMPKFTDPELKEMINDIHESSVRLIDIVNDFLDTSRLEQGKITFKKETFDLVELAQEVIKEFQVTSTQKNLSLVLESQPEHLPSVIADRNRCKQIMINLVGNGLKFTEQGGVTIKLNLDGHLAHIVVHDTGRGIPQTMQPLLFRKFQQAGESLFTRDSTRGTGLGLYISKLMVEGMGGTIKLKSSEPGRGSSFEWTIPLA